MVYLELHKKLRECNAHLTHEFLHEFCHLLIRDSPTTEAKIEGVIEELLVIGAEVKADGNGGRGTDSRGTGVQNLRCIFCAFTRKMTHPAQPT